MRFQLFLYSFIVVLVSCRQNDRRVPGDVLPPDKMEAVLWDMMRADVFVNDYLLKKDTAAVKKEESIALYRQILSLHRISKEEFRKSFAFYQTKPVLLKAIMDSLASHPDADPAKIYGPRTPVTDSTVRRDSIAPIY
jgi:hypothetical protein